MQATPVLGSRRVSGNGRGNDVKAPASAVADASLLTAGGLLLLSHFLKDGARVMDQTRDQVVMER